MSYVVSLNFYARALASLLEVSLLTYPFLSVVFPPHAATQRWSILILSLIIVQLYYAVSYDSQGLRSLRQARLSGPSML